MGGRVHPPPNRRWTMSSPRRGRRAGVLAIPFLVAGLIGAGTVPAVASTPNMVAQWNQVAENVVVPAPAMTQIEGLMYMAYTQLAVYDAVVAIDGGYVPYGPALDAPHGASADAAVVEAAYETLLNYFPTASGTLSAARTATLATIPDGTAKNDGIAVGA